MNHHTKDKGDLGVLKVKCDLCSKGYSILSPETEHAPFDLVAYRGENFKRMQVKYRSVKNGAVEVSFRTTWADKNGSHIKYYDLSEIDIIAIYCPDTDKCYYLNPRNFNKAIRLRVETPKNNQSINIKFANDYLEVP
tara:strand:+ start:5059 stop:5469 length:411 start_codon:yes stop_codon:yes gene_type:complete